MFEHAEIVPFELGLCRKVQATTHREPKKTSSKAVRLLIVWYKHYALNVQHVLTIRSSLPTLDHPFLLHSHVFCSHLSPPSIFLPVFSMCFYTQKQYISPACMNHRLVVVHQHLIMENESNAQLGPVGLPLMVQLSLELAQRRLRRNLRRVCCFWCFLGSTIAQETAIVKGSETEEQQNVTL